MPSGNVRRIRLRVLELYCFEILRGHNHVRLMRRRAGVDAKSGPLCINIRATFSRASGNYKNLSTPGL